MRRPLFRGRDSRPSARVTSLGRPWVTRALCSAGLAVASLAPNHYLRGSQLVSERRVTGIRLESDAQLTLGDFEEQVTQEVGQPLDRTKVSESLKKLYATGRFADIRADVKPKDGGVELIFVTRAAYFSGAVRAEGAPKALDPKALSDASRLRLGQALSEADLAEASERLRAVLAESGYYQARIQHRLIRHPETQEADILFTVAAGSRARLKRAEIEGQTVVPPESVAAIAGWKPGIHLTAAGVERGLLKLRKFYSARGRLHATTNILKREFDPPSGTEILRVRVEAGPLIRVRLGGASLSNSKLKEILPIFRDGVVDEDALARSAQILEDYFQRQNYFSATVKADRVDHAGGQEIEVTFVVTLGTRGEFAGYGFLGYHSVPAIDLTAALAEAQNDPSSKPTVFSNGLVARHVDAILGLYHSRGFPDSRVTPRLQNDTDVEPRRLSVTYQIEEGPRTKVAHLVLHGVGRETENALWPSLLTKPGEPYSPERAQADEDRILSYFADRGYTRAAVNRKTSPSSHEHETDVEFHIEPGLQERIQQVVLMGHQKTRDSVVRRELELREGEPLSQRNVLESQRRLYDLGIFNQVQITRQDTQSLSSAQTVLVNLEEARRWTVGYGGGIEVQRLGSNQPQGQFKASPRLSLDVTRLNVGGRAQTFTIRGQLSNLEQGGGLGYLIPRLLNRRDLSLRLNALVERSRDVLTFTADRREGSIAVEKRFNPSTLLVGRYTFRRVQALNISTRLSPEQIPLFSRPARIGGLGAGYVHDHRDNPADATQGSYSLADTLVAWNNFGSEANFIRFSGEYATYRRLGSHLILARSTRFGVESPFEHPGRSLVPAIPLPERFFMGGSESHRGFSINQAGPRDPLTGFPIGGHAVFFNSVELRAPFRDKRLGLVAFEDAGNVFSTIRKMRLLKFGQSSPTDFDYTAHAVGMGIRYKTPIAPVRFDVGYGLNPTRYQVQVQNGSSLPPTLEVRRLSKFQFFLSIGQSF